MDYNIIKEYDYWYDTIVNCGWDLMHVPKELIDYAMCEAAINTSSRSLSIVPIEFIDYELCKLAVSRFGYALKYVPIEYLTTELFTLACTNSKWALNTILPKYQTFALILISLNISNDSYEYINWDILDINQQEFIKLKYGL